MNNYRKNRKLNQLRPITITTGLQEYPAASVLWQQGNTKVLASLSCEDGVPAFLEGKGIGWLTAEYSLLPGSTLTRCDREVNKGRQGGRTMEIQRLIGRSLRQAVDLRALGEKTLKIDCDVIQADGGTRTASVSAAWLCLALAVKENKLPKEVLKQGIASVSVGIIGGEVSLDLEYAEDSKADVDMNLVMTDRGTFVEIQGTGEGSDFSPEELSDLLAFGKHGIEEIFKLEKEFLQ